MPLGLTRDQIFEAVYQGQPALSLAEGIRRLIDVIAENNRLIEEQLEAAGVLKLKKGKVDHS